MIINVYSVILLFIDGVCLCLAVFLAGCAARQLRRTDYLRDAEKRETFEKGITLVLLVSIILVGLRALSWPLMYATLQSFVPTIEGAMCIYGVTQILPALTTALEIVKPIIFFTAGGWLILCLLDHGTRTSPLARKNTLVLLGVSLVMLVEIPLEMALFIGIRPTFVVTCCTTVADVGDRVTSVIPTELLGKEYKGLLTGLFLGLNVVLLAAAAWGAFSKTMARRGLGRTFLIAGGSLLGLADAAVAWLAASEILAPVWMHLPYHHCLYCFIAYRDAPVAVGLFLLGIFCLLWAGLIHAIARASEVEPPATAAIRRCHGWALFLLGGAFGMALIHLAIG